MFTIAELPLNDRGAVYHLDLRPEEIASTIITVGDPNRVGSVSKYFDVIETKRAHREYVSHTGRIGNKKLTVLSTGIGMPNIDIALTELDVLLNVDLDARIPHKKPQSANIIRLGTTGGLQKDMPLGSLVVSKFAIGFDSLMDYYDRPENTEEDALYDTVYSQLDSCPPFFTSACAKDLLICFQEIASTGITATFGGFYGPQGRKIRLPLCFPNMAEQLQAINFDGLKVTNYEMETAAILGLGAALGHRCLSMSVVLANRALDTYNANVDRAIENMIVQSLEKIVQLA